MGRNAISFPIFLKFMFAFGAKVNERLKYFLEKIPQNANVLDLGSGMGANGNYFRKHGFNVTCVDNDEEITAYVRNEFPDITLFCGNILNFQFEREKYDLVLAIDVLHNFRFAEVKKIIRKIYSSLKTGGFLYIQLFSTLDPRYKLFLELADRTDERNTFYVRKSKSFVHFFEKEEVNNLFLDGDILELRQVSIKDIHPPHKEHLHDVFRVIVRKKYKQ